LRSAVTLPIILLALAVSSCTAPRQVVTPLPAPRAVSWEDSVLATLTLEQKVGQMLTVGAFGHYVSDQTDEYARLARFVQEIGVGGVILWQSDVYESAYRLNSLQRLARVPLLVGADLERGLAMRIRRGTSIPDAMAIGATRDPLYAYEAGRAIAEEARVLGIHQNYAPVADINTNAANPVINTRAFSDDVRLVEAMTRAFVRGSLDGGVIPTVKHFPGHGDTGTDSHLELPVLGYPRARLDSMELLPFRSAIREPGVSVMVGHIAVPAVDPESPRAATLSPPIVTGLLRNEMGFGGLIVSDAMEMRAVTRDHSSASMAVEGVKAGLDMLLMVPDVEAAHAALVAAVHSGELTEARIDASVRRILAAKKGVGLDRSRMMDPDRISRTVGTREHALLAQEIAVNAMTLLRAENGILPLTDRHRLASIVISDSDDSRIDVHRPSYPWPNEPPGRYFNLLLRKYADRVDTYRLSPDADEDEFRRAFDAARHADVTVLPVFVKVRTSSGRITIPQNILPFLTQLERSGVRTIMVVFGTPYIVTAMPKAKAILCAYGDSEPLTEAAVNVLFGRRSATGTLPVTIPGVFPIGSGIVPGPDRLVRDEESLAQRGRFTRVDSLLEAAIRDTAFPAAQVLVAQNGKILYRRSLGRYSYAPDAQAIDDGTMFDMASVTKVLATTTAAMKLVDEGKIGLDDPVGRTIPQFAEGEKSAITIRHLLTHRSGLPPFRRFFLFCRNAEEALDSAFATPLVARPGDTTIYSDIGMITMGKVIERVTGQSLADYLRKQFYDPLGMTSTMFTPPRALLGRIAPTEIDTLWRKRLVRGEVHDENAALLGGVSGHAGLFSTASDAAVLLQMLLNKGTYAGRRYVSDRTVVEFTRSQQPFGDRHLGWDSRSPRGSSAGSLFSLSSFGHTGFTGTSVWVDPERKLLVVFLTNRVHPTRANQKIARVRPALHDAVVEALEGNGARQGNAVAPGN
jgi:beta-N-acetylhexosaminidase